MGDNVFSRDSESVFRVLSLRISRICESVLHLTHVQMGTYRENGNHLENNLELRVGYLRKQITEEDFKTKVQRANKMHEKKREMCAVLDMFVTTVGDIMYRIKMFVAEDHFTQTTRPEEQIGVMLDEVEVIRTYSNECLLTIATTYGSKKYQLIMYDTTIARLVGNRNILV